MKPVKLFAHCLWAVITVIFVVACSGGGGGGGGSVPGVAAAQTGTVGLIVTDNPTEEFDAILVTFSCAKLLGDDGQVTIFEGEETFDLLGLRDVTELFAVNDKVPVGTYSKVRLCVEDVELISRDDDGNEISSEVRKLLGNGKLDLNPRGDFDLGPDQTVLIQLDWDAEKSIKFNGPLKKNVSLRPVVFVNIIGKDLPELGKLLRLHGVVQDLDREERDFELCETHFLRDEDDEDSEADDIRDGCVEVVLEDDASIFNIDGEPVMLDAVENGDEATVFGRVLRAVPFDDDDDCDSDDSDSDSDSGDFDDGDDGDCDADDRRITVAAGLVELGPKGTFARLTGTATDSVDAEDQFPLELDPGQGFADMTEIPVQLSGTDELPGTKIVDASGDPVSRDAIVAGVRALVRGVINLDPNQVNASLVVLRAAIDGADKLSGVIVAVESDGSGLRLLPDDASLERCVRADADTDTFLISEDEEDGSSSEMVPLNRDLETLDADVYGEEGVDGCFDADTIIAFDEPFPGS